MNDFNFDEFDFDDLDFGIKPVSSDQVDQTTIQTEKLDKVSANSESVSERLSDIEVILQDILLVTNREYNTRLVEKESELETENEKKFKSLENLIIPLLMNLAKDSENNPYIHWPNRRGVVENQIKRILTITRE